ncbi:MAG: nitrogen fixation protein NifZ [Comamonadaceae bacterium]|nr:nitrogen fixation protein NifZ [Comamonadaceae bacterium]
MPQAEDDQLLIAASGPGEIVDVGHHAEANVPIYRVDFGLCVLSARLEEELKPAGEAVPDERRGAPAADRRPIRRQRPSSRWRRRASRARWRASATATVRPRLEPERGGWKVVSANCSLAASTPPAAKIAIRWFEPDGAGRWRLHARDHAAGRWTRYLARRGTVAGPAAPGSSACTAGERPGVLAMGGPTVAPGGVRNPGARRRQFGTRRPAVRRSTMSGPVCLGQQRRRRRRRRRRSRRCCAPRSRSRCGGTRRRRTNPASPGARRLPAVRARQRVLRLRRAPAG